MAKSDYNSQDYRHDDEKKSESTTKKHRQRVENAVKWRKDAGYDEAYVDQLTTWFIAKFQ